MLICHPRLDARAMDLSLWRMSLNYIYYCTLNQYAMFKAIIKSDKYCFFILASSFALLIITLSFLNIKNYFAEKKEVKVLSVQQESFDEEEYWTNFLKLNPNYFPGYVELTKIQLAKGERDKAIGTILKAKEINPNSPLITELEQSLR